MNTEFDGSFFELMAEIPVMSLLACLFAFTFEPFRSRTFLKTWSRQRCVIVGAAAVLGIAALFVRICMVNSRHVPMLVATVVIMPFGLAIGCGVVLLFRRYCPGLLKSAKLVQGLFAFAALFFFALAASIGFMENGSWQTAMVLAGLGVLELYSSFYFPKLMTKQRSALTGV